MDITKTSVIIPCYILDNKLLSLTLTCIQSIRDASCVELIVVDNASPLETGIKHEADIYIRNSKNLGYVKALNQGLKLCSGEYIVFGGNDVEVPLGWEEVYRDILDKTPNCGAVVATDSTNEKPKGVSLWKENNALGYWSMVKRNTLLDIGLFDERFFTTWGDVDYAFRLEKAGLHHLTTCEPTVKHYCQATREKIGKLEDWDFEQGRIKFIEKWGNDPHGKKLLKDYGLV